MAISKTLIAQFYNGIFRQAASPQTATLYETMADANTALTAMINAAGTSVDPLVRMYQVTFNRVPDSPGMTSWTIPFSAQILSLPDIANAFAQSPEFKTFYGSSLSNTQFVKTLYLNILQHEGDTKGTQGWIAALDSGSLTRAQVITGFSEAQEFKDKVVDNLAVFLTQCADLTENYQGTLFDKVRIKSSNTTLSVNVDLVSSNHFYGYVIGEAGVSQAVSTLSPSDVLIGIGQNPTANINLINTQGGGTLNAGGQFNNINTLVISAGGDGGSALDLSRANGLSNVTVQNGTDDLTLSNVTILVPLTILSNNGSVTVDYTDQVVSRQTPAIVNVNGVGNNSPSPVVIDIGGNNPSNGFNTIILNSNGEGSHIGQLTTSNDNDHRNLVINGPSGVQIDDVNSNAIVNLDMSGSSGDNTINISRSTGNTTVQGGSGNDNVIFNANNLDPLDQINLGGGINMLSLEFNQPVLELSSLTEPQANELSDHGLYALSQPAKATFGTPQTAALNAAAHVDRVAFIADKSLRSGEVTVGDIDLSSLKTMQRIDLTGFGGVFAKLAGMPGSGKSAVTVSGISTGETIGLNDITGAPGDDQPGSPAHGVNAITLSYTLPDQAFVELLASPDRDHNLIIKGGNGGHGGTGIVISNFNVLKPYILYSLDTQDGRAHALDATIIVGGDASTALGARAGVAIDNPDGLALILRGNHALTIVGGQTHDEAGRAFGFSSMVNVDGSQLKGALTLQGSNITSKGDTISGGTGNDWIEGANGADQLRGNSGADTFFFRNGSASEIANTAAGSAGELALVNDAQKIETLLDFTSGIDKIAINTNHPFFGTYHVQFTQATKANVTHITLGTVNAANMGDLFSAINKAVAGVASNASTANIYVVHTSIVNGGLANASNSHFAIVNDALNTIDQNDMILNLGNNALMNNNDWSWQPVDNPANLRTAGIPAVPFDLA